MPSAPAHSQEHSLEVQLPFLQRVLGEFTLVPLAVGAATHGEVAQVLERLWGGPETLIVISTDLSHYHEYREAKRIDGATLLRIAAFATDLTHDEACGATPLNGLLGLAKSKGLRIQLLSACNSGDTAGGKARVVGYSSFAVYDRGAVSTEEAGRTLVGIARAAIETSLNESAREKSLTSNASTNKAGSNRINATTGRVKIPRRGSRGGRRTRCFRATGRRRRSPTDGVPVPRGLSASGCARSPSRPAGLSRCPRRRPSVPGSSPR